MKPFQNLPTIQKKILRVLGGMGCVGFFSLQMPTTFSPTCRCFWLPDLWD